ncbi:MAG: M13 family metallopeptidase [Bacteroidia bacterium]
MQNLIVFALAILLFGACGEKEVTETKGPKPGIDIANMDTTTSPIEDFYQYANGGWLANNTIPEDETSWGSINELFEENRAILRGVVEQGKESMTEGSDAYKAALFYEVAMDENLLENGRTAMDELLEAAAEVKDKTTLVAALATLRANRIGGFYRGYVSQDARRGDFNTYYLSQGGLSLPDRDYYLKKGKESDEIRSAFTAHVASMFELVGDDKEAAATNAALVLKLETALAEAFMPRTELRNPLKTYNKMVLSDFQERADAFDWKALFTAEGLGEMDTLIVRTRPYFEKLPKAMNAGGGASAWREYLRYQVISSLAEYLDKDFADLHFDFYQTTLNGVEKQEARWKKTLSMTDRMMGEALGQLYVVKAFPPEAKQDMVGMLGYIRTAMGTRIDQLPWMSDETKKEAHKKLASIRIKIGYPDEWRDYGKLEVGNESYAHNILKARQFSKAYNINKYGQAPDPNEWGMTPPTVNAYYNPLQNEIVFPAGILQPPLYDYNVDPAVNFGGIGAVIGHEISHGFDDSGRRYDWQGSLQDWWTKEDDERFKKRADKLIAQANSYVVLDSLHVNGRLTLGENIADLGGILIAYEAFKLYQKDHPVSESINGLNPSQRFFIAFTQVWRRKIRDERAKQLLLTDSHAPGEYRGRMPLTNIPAFWEAFDIPKGSPMRASDSTLVEIW